MRDTSAPAFRRRAAVSALAAIAASAAAFLLLPLTGGFFVVRDLHDLAALVTVFSLVATPSGYFAKVIYGEYRTRRRASTGIYLELADTLVSLDRDRFGNDVVSFVRADSGKRITYMNRTLNLDFYYSLVRSGNLGFVAPEIQQPIQDAFGKIKDHNGILDRISMIVSEQKTPFPREAYPLYERVSKIEEELLRDIPALLKKLERRFGI